jgi:hypothetical protein
MSFVFNLNIIKDVPFLGRREGTFRASMESWKDPCKPTVHALAVQAQAVHVHAIHAHAVEVHAVHEHKK